MLNSCCCFSGSEGKTSKLTGNQLTTSMFSHKHQLFSCRRHVHLYAHSARSGDGATALPMNGRQHLGYFGSTQNSGFMESGGWNFLCFYAFFFFLMWPFSPKVNCGIRFSILTMEMCLNSWRVHVCYDRAQSWLRNAEWRNGRVSTAHSHSPGQECAGSR